MAMLTTTPAVAMMVNLGLEAGAWMRSTGRLGRMGGLRPRTENSKLGRNTGLIRAAGDGDQEQVPSSKKRAKTLSSAVRPSPSVRISIKRQVAAPKDRTGSRSRSRISSLMDEIAGFMAPREKGDIRDVLLMSLSFAVLVYISQHLVHAYCALIRQSHHNF